LNENELINIKRFYMVAAVICAVNATPILGGLINNQFANFLTIAVFVISVMILLKPRMDGLTRIPCVLGVLAAALDAAAFFIGRAEQYTLLGFVSDYTFPLNFTEQQLFTPRQMDALPLLVTIGGLGFISWMFITVAAATYFINYSRVRKMESA